MKKIILLILIVSTFWSCSKTEQMTTSKIKIVGSKIMSGSLATKASNGLILYGKSSDGKSFLKKIDNDSVDMDFPNGNWNFYAVSWESAGLPSLFTGTTYCGKQEGVKLSGSDVSINLTLDNANCNDSSMTGSNADMGGHKTLPTWTFTSCRDLTSVGIYADDAKCARTTFNNRGMATHVQMVVPEYKDFGNGLQDFNPSMKSACIKLDGSSDANAPLPAQDGFSLNQLHLPDSINGFMINLRVFYTSNHLVNGGCDEANGIDALVIPQNPTPRTKFFQTPGGASLDTKNKIYFQANEAQVCRDQRMTTVNHFAGGYGTYYSPYIVCTPDQFSQITALLGDGVMPTNHASFELASDLDFSSGFLPIGGGVNIAANSFGGTASSPILNRALFEGNNHRLKNVFIQCDNTTSSIGLFRNAINLDINNLTMDRATLICDMGASNSNVGFVVGNGTDINFKNIRVSGHIEGYLSVGGIAGLLGTNFTMDDVHSFVDLKSETNNAGGLVGLASSINSMTIQNTSVKGVVRTPNSGTYLGGLIGNLSTTGGSTSSITSVLSNIYIDGNSTLGGLIGSASLGTSSTVNINHYYTKGAINASAPSSPVIGGVIGAVSGSATNLVTGTGFSSIAFNQQVATIASTNAGGLFGTNASSNVSCTTFAYRANTSVLGNTSGCNVGSNSYSTNLTFSNFANTMISSFQTVWQQKNGGLPHLQMEYDPSRMMISYLRAGDCEGDGYASLKGSGTTADPKIICTTAQFLAMSQNVVYKLGDDLFFDIPITTPFAQGNYYLVGNGYSLYAPTIQFPSTGTSHFGIFSELNSLSLLSNFKIIFGKGAANPTVTSDVNNYAYAILAGTNAGRIEAVKFIKSKMYIPYFGGSIGSNSRFGTIVGVNTGTLDRIDANIDIKAGAAATGSFTSNGTGEWGWIAAYNTGTISRINLAGEVNINPSGIYSGYSDFGSLVVGNTGTIGEVKIQGTINLTGYSGGTSKTVLSHLVKTNTGTIQDILYIPNNVLLTSGTSGGVVNTNVTGSILRTIIAPTASGANINFPLAGNVAESFCYNSTGIANCYNSISSSFTDPNFTVSGSLFSGAGGLTGNLPSNSNAWLMTSFPYPQSFGSKVWSLPAGATLPSLARADGIDDAYVNVFN